MRSLNAMMDTPRICKNADRIVLTVRVELVQKALKATQDFPHGKLSLLEVE